MPKKKAKEQDADKFTADFDSVLSIIKWNCLGFVFLDFFIPFVISQQLHASGLELGIVFSINPLGDVLAAPIAGWLTDHMSKRKLVLIGANGRAFAYALMYASVVTSSLAGLAVTEFALGFLVTFFWVPISTIVAQKSNKACRSQAYGKRRFAQGVGTVIGTIFSVAIFMLAYQFVPNNPFLPCLSLIVFGLANVLAGVSFYRNVDEKLLFIPRQGGEACETAETVATGTQPNHIDETRKGIVISSKISAAFIAGFILLCIAVFISEVNESATKPFFRVYLLDRIEADAGIAILAVIPGQLICLFLAPSLGKIADRVRPALSMAVICSCGAFTTFLTIMTTSVIVFGVLQVFDQTLAMAAALIVENLISRVSIRHRGKMFGVKTIAGNLGDIAGPLIGGMLWDTVAITAPFTFSIVIELSLIPVYFFALHFIKRDLTEKLDNVDFSGTRQEPAFEVAAKVGE